MLSHRRPENLEMVPAELVERGLTQPGQQIGRADQILEQHVAAGLPPTSATRTA
jgi:hypothetical protein